MKDESPVVRLKFEMCKNWREKGVCKYGDKCLFAHGEKELTKREAPKPEPESMDSQKLVSSDHASAQVPENTFTKEDVLPSDFDHDLNEAWLAQKPCSSHVVSVNKSPLGTYPDYAATSHVSQRSSFDDSFTDPVFNPFLSLNPPQEPRESSFIGDGLFSTEEATDLETNLIEISMHHIQSILSHSSQSTCDDKQRSPPRRLKVF